MISGITISANFAISADGKITNAEHRSSGWTSPQDHQRLLALRKLADAIIVGKNTLQTDNMSLMVPGQERQPLRCVVSRRADFSGNEKLFHSPSGGAIHLLCTEYVAKEWPTAQSHVGTLRDFIETLRDQYQVKHLHCEGGAQLFRAMTEEVGVNTFYLTWAAHTIFGGAFSPTISGAEIAPYPITQHYTLTTAEPDEFTGEVFLRYDRQEETQ